MHCRTAVFPSTPETLSVQASFINAFSGTIVQGTTVVGYGDAILGVILGGFGEMQLGTPTFGGNLRYGDKIELMRLARENLRYQAANRVENKVLDGNGHVLSSWVSNHSVTSINQTGLNTAAAAAYALDNIVFTPGAGAGATFTIPTGYTWNYNVDDTCLDLPAEEETVP